MKNISKIKINDYLSTFIPILIISGVMNLCNQIHKKKNYNKISELIIPVFLIFFISPLIANLVYVQMIISGKLLIYFFSGIIFYYVFKKYRFEFKFLGFIGNVSFLVDLKNNDKSLEMVVCWYLVNEFVGVFVRQLVVREFEFILSDYQFFRIIGSVLLICVSKKLELSDIFFVFLLVSMDFILKTLENKKSGEAEKLKENKTTEEDEKLKENKKNLNPKKGELKGIELKVNKKSKDYKEKKSEIKKKLKENKNLEVKDDSENKELKNNETNRKIENKKKKKETKNKKLTELDKSPIKNSKIIISGESLIKSKKK